MVNDRENENKVKKYAAEHHYTILANTFGTLEYVRYSFKDRRTTSFLKWSKGCDNITVTNEGITKKIYLSELGK